LALFNDFLVFKQTSNSSAERCILPFSFPVDLLLPYQWIRQNAPLCSVQQGIVKPHNFWTFSVIFWFLNKTCDFSTVCGAACWRIRALEPEECNNFWPFSVRQPLSARTMLTFRSETCAFFSSHSSNFYPLPIFTYIGLVYIWIIFSSPKNKLSDINKTYIIIDNGQKFKLSFSQNLRNL
jgi:hypothetical protein